MTSQLVKMLIIRSSANLLFDDLLFEAASTMHVEVITAFAASRLALLLLVLDA